MRLAQELLSTTQSCIGLHPHRIKIAYHPVVRLGLIHMRKECIFERMIMVLELPTCESTRAAVCSICITASILWLGTFLPLLKSSIIFRVPEMNPIQTWSEYYGLEKVFKLLLCDQLQCNEVAVKL